MFKLSSDAIDCDALRAELEDVRAGALCTFEGRVRNHNEGQAVSLLEYEAYDALALKEGEKILEEARKRFEIYDCVCVHRVGKLALGDIAVWVGAIAAHRDAAFSATRYIIDEIKSRVPIWKKEHYVSGESDWVNCSHGHHENESFKLDPLELSSSELNSFEVIDIREPDEDPSHLLGSLLRRDVRSAPLSTIDPAKPGLDSSKQYLFVCQRGARSEKLVEQLRANGFANTFSLLGGVEAMRRKFIA